MAANPGRGDGGNGAVGVGRRGGSVERRAARAAHEERGPPSATARTKRKVAVKTTHVRKKERKHDKGDGPQALPHTNGRACDGTLPATTKLHSRPLSRTHTKITTLPSRPQTNQSPKRRRAVLVEIPGQEVGEARRLVRHLVEEMRRHAAKRLGGNLRNEERRKLVEYKRERAGRCGRHISTMTHESWWARRILADTSARRHPTGVDSVNACENAARRNTARIYGFFRVADTQAPLLRRSGSLSGVPGRTVDPIRLFGTHLFREASRQGVCARYSSCRAGFAHSSALFWSTCSKATVDSHSSIVPHHDPKSKHAFELRQTAHFKTVLLFYNCFKGRCRHHRSHSSLRFFSSWPTYPRVVCIPHPGSTVTYRGPSQIPDLSINPSGTENGTLASTQAYFVRLHLRTFNVFFVPHACLPPHNPILPPVRNVEAAPTGRRGHEVGDESDRSPPGRFAHRLYTGRPHAFALPAAFRKSTNGRQEEKKPGLGKNQPRPSLQRLVILESWRGGSTELIEPAISASLAQRGNGWVGPSRGLYG
ncbi:hypothetical protein B0H13DRAFT_1892429 [Mycena leptocephala]|nr:hypothetical protein B0H13DRAFT_1892429 [Mycena leptocephala]